MRRADDPPEAAAAFLEFWRREGERHFRVEEEVLLPLWAHLGTIDSEAAERLSREHLSIRSAAIAIDSQTPSLESLRAVGEELAAHVRFEERELFRLLEADLDEDGLTRLAKAVSDAEDDTDT
jgi:hypothetical protein